MFSFVLSLCFFFFHFCVLFFLMFYSIIYDICFLLFCSILLALCSIVCSYLYKSLVGSVNLVIFVVLISLCCNLLVFLVHSLFYLYAKWCLWFYSSFKFSSFCFLTYDVCFLLCGSFILLLCFFVENFYNFCMLHVRFFECCDSFSFSYLFFSSKSNSKSSNSTNSTKSLNSNSDGYSSSVKERDEDRAYLNLIEFVQVKRANVLNALLVSDFWPSYEEANLPIWRDNFMKLVASDVTFYENMFSSMSAQDLSDFLMSNGFRSLDDFWNSFWGEVDSVWRLESDQRKRDWFNSMQLNPSADINSALDNQLFLFFKSSWSKSLLRSGGTYNLLLEGLLVELEKLGSFEQLPVGMVNDMLSEQKIYNRNVAGSFCPDFILTSFDRAAAASFSNVPSVGCGVSSVFDNTIIFDVFYSVGSNPLLDDELLRWRTDFLYFESGCMVGSYVVFDRNSYLECSFSYMLLNTTSILLNSILYCLLNDLSCGVSCEALLGSFLFIYMVNEYLNETRGSCVFLHGGAIGVCFNTERVVYLEVQSHFWVFNLSESSFGNDDPFLDFFNEWWSTAEGSPFNMNSPLGMDDSYYRALEKWNTISDALNEKWLAENNDVFFITSPGRDYFVNNCDDYYVVNVYKSIRDDGSLDSGLSQGASELINMMSSGLHYNELPAELVNFVINKRDEHYLGIYSSACGDEGLPFLVSNEASVLFDQLSSGVRYDSLPDKSVKFVGKYL